MANKARKFFDYTPTALYNFSSLEELSIAIAEEFQRLEGAITGVELAALSESNAVPDKLYDGLIALADGTNWNPGKGAGLYIYQDSAWNYLGPGAMTSGIRAVTATTDTATIQDGTILGNAASNAITITLPTAATSTGIIINIKKIDATGNAVTVDGNGSETIDDTTTAVLTGQYNRVSVQSDGTEWWII